MHGEQKVSRAAAPRLGIARKGRAGKRLALALYLALAAPVQAADNGPRQHAEGSYDPATGIYTVAAGDVLGAIARRFGLSLSALEQQNDLSSTQIKVGQQLAVGAASEDITVVIGPAQAPAAANEPPAAQTQPPPAPTPPVSDLPADPWPIQVQVDGKALTVYQPQVESWTGNQLNVRAAVAVKPAGQRREAFGVVRLQARTQVDRAQRQVVLEDLKVQSADFPTLPDDGAALASAAQTQFSQSIRIVSLDRLEASLAAADVTPPGGVAVKNKPPRIIVSETPAVLVPIQGLAVWKPIPNSQLQRVINTRAVILATDPEGPYYLHLLDGWMAAQSLQGPWSRAESTPAGVDEVASHLATTGEADLLNGSPSTPTLELLSAGPPVVYVSETPAELIVFKGKPNLVPIKDTALLWASNTTADVIVDTDDSDYYVLLAGRWFRAPALSGPWTYVASTDLPADFARIPEDSPAGVVLASVAGTPQAREAVIANGIPQTATVPLTGGPTFTLQTDGPPTIALLKGTDLEYVVNARTPVIRVNGETYYALQEGIWFQSDSLDGPWTVASSVPADIYSIPPSSPLHYVTYVHIYGATPEVVYEGYTPGYLGTVIADDGVVVYGTGYDYQPWIGDTWVAAPETYDLAAAPVYNPAVGYAYGFGLGLATAAAADAYWGGAYYRPYHAGYGCCAVTSANVYGHWGDTVASGTRAWYAGPGEAWTGARGSYVNEGTGTTGDFAAGRGYDAWTGTAGRGYGRTFDTAGGTTGAVERGERYNPATGNLAYGARGTATGPGGSTVSRDTAAAEDRHGRSAAVHQATLDSARTGETHTVTTARVGDNLYAGADGHVYRNTGDGWQTHDDDGWHAAAGDTGWADRESRARTFGDERANAFYRGGWGERAGRGFGGRAAGGGFRGRR
ncbi:MAG: LysM peptidoglycan-binding domain-containing protein [Thiohalocapsa sp.]|uniref:LysM peptidoglycan-binding domain-containing protein n=1 Tax=Thiohalocapsa sp. TaxID=2497641 RepID=UPI0025D17E60|nr:LysM peptidoglycan-binding domain-containing protein [Thiohalocapsa sp.]MCG6941493.1 LysM peptidoglycan-binding domain-containing protein [Thiohalocapsa sp.]